MRGFRFAMAFTVCVVSAPTIAQEQSLPTADNGVAVADTNAHVKRLELSMTPGRILHTNSFLNGDNYEQLQMNHSNTLRLTFGMGAAEGSSQSRRLPATYQGVGVEMMRTNRLLGNPLSVFVYQTSRMARLSPRLSLHYEWNLGLAFGWRQYDPMDNPDNRVIGSDMTANMHAAVLLNWRLSRRADLTAGLAYSHFSNGNTTIPNGGLNVVGPRVGVAYYPNRQASENEPKATPLTAEERARKIDWDVVLYASYRRQGYITEEFGSVALPNKFLVIGANVNPMMRFNRRFRAGLSADLVMDRGANIDIEDYLLRYRRDGYQPVSPATSPLKRQMALGLSARGEFVMPIFSINAGLGHNIIGAYGDLNCWYQVLALKVAILPKFFLHIGYTLQDFQYPDHLMLGLGYRFSAR